jgi:hypothetical protein
MHSRRACSSAAQDKVLAVEPEPDCDCEAEEAQQSKGVSRRGRRGEEVGRRTENSRHGTHTG